jgi:hypothetical protein
MFYKSTKSKQAYTSPFVKPEPQRWYMPSTIKEPAKPKNTWLSQPKPGKII